MKVIGYIRVSTDEQVESGAGLAAQRSQIEAAVVGRGWELLATVEDAGVSGKSLERVGISAALVELAARRADGIVVAKLDRLSRSLQDFVGLMALAKKQGWHVVALDLGIDTSTSTGRLVANIMASVAEWEREAIGARTREGMAAKKAAGVKFGRPSAITDAVRSRIRAERDAGRSLQQIAYGLNLTAVPTGHRGLKWWPSTVRAALQNRSPRAV